jgi:hypothetical protein
MPRLLCPRVVLALVMIASFAGFVPAPDAAPVNRLTNPGFEAGMPQHPWMPAGWDTSRSGLSTVFFGRDTLLAHGGQYAVTVANVSALWSFSHNWSQTILVNRDDWGKDAVFSVWTRSTGIEGRAYVLIQAYRDTVTRLARERGFSRDSMAHILNVKPIDDPLYDLGWKRQQFSEGETDWVRREVRIFVPPLTNVLFVRCGLIGTGQLMLDDASLRFEPARPAPPVRPNVNLLADPGFEEGGLAWEFSLPPYKNMVGRLDTVITHSGKRSAFFTGGEDAYIAAHAGPCQAIPNRNLAGKHLRMTGWFKTDSLNGNCYVKFYFNTLHGIEHPPTFMALSGTKDWAETVFEADAPKDTYEVWVWYCYDAPTEGRMWVDDCSLMVVNPPRNGKKGGAP